MPPLLDLLAILTYAVSVALIAVCAAIVVLKIWEK